MSGDSLTILLAVISVWALATAVKAYDALRGKQAYVFKFWDGGMWQEGKRLTRTGVKIKLATSAVTCAGGASLLAGVVPHHAGLAAILLAAALGLVGDFTTIERD